MAAQVNVERFEYLSPVPGSRMVSPSNNIIIRLGHGIDEASLYGRSPRVEGSTSGLHTGEFLRAADAKTLLFIPDQPFAFGETVQVTLGGGLRTSGGGQVPTLAFDFTVSEIDPKRQPRRGLDEAFPEMSEVLVAPDSDPFGFERRSLAHACDTLPPNYPSIGLTTNAGPDAGNLFLTPFGFGTPGPLVIMDNFGNPIFYRKLPGGKSALDFTRQPSGLLTYFSAGAVSGSGTDPNDYYYGMDSTYAIVDSFFTGNGYITDIHDLVVLPNGNALLMSYDPQPVGMDTVVAGGNPDAVVTGLIIQEIDTAKNVVFQWRSWDHVPITDMIEAEGRALTDSLIDYIHGNAVDLAPDGNVVISSRHTNEITKIDRATGNIIWRWGLNAKNNDFTFVGDTRGFSHQHDIRALAGDRYTLFDNGNALAPLYSRAVEYELDENAMTATQVWEYRNSPDTYGGFMGAAQRLPNGGTLVGWGGTFAPPGATEVSAGGNKAFEIGYNPGTFSYRARRFEWQTTLFETDSESLDFGTVVIGSPATLPLTITNNGSSPLTITCFSPTNEAFSVLEATPIVVPAGMDVVVTVQFDPIAAAPLEEALYVRTVSSDELIAQSVALTGEGKGLLPAASDVGLLTLLMLLGATGAVYMIRRHSLALRNG